MASKNMASERALKMNVSGSLFRLATESIRLFSNKHLHFSSLGDVVNERVREASTIASNYQPNSIREHLRIIPTDGNVGVELTISEASATEIDRSIPALEELIGSSVSFVSAISIILFDFVVDENRTEVINKLGLSPEDAAAFKKAAKRSETNVIPFR